MKILLIGDIHEDIDKAKRIIDFVECDFVLQTGDFGAYSDFSKPIYFIAGNHENWNILRNMDVNKIRFKNLYHIKTAEIIRVVNDKEILILSGLNGNYSEKRYEVEIKERERHFNKKEVEKCKKLRNIDILLSHEAPADIGFMKPQNLKNFGSRKSESRKDFLGNGKDVGIKPVKEILDRIKPRFLFFGHHHIFFDKTIGVTRVIGLAYVRREYYILDTSKNEIRRYLLK